LFQNARYLPLTAQGSAAHHLCAFARPFEHDVVVVAVPRLCATLLGDKKQYPIGQEVWGQTVLPIPDEIRCPEFRNVLTGEKVLLQADDSAAFISAADLLGNFPVALLLGEISPPAESAAKPS
jgi:(1->4)-alpha-D-glucan 1-alpha-D-glucosylmutase